jgi:hypothetical protein
MHTDLIEPSFGSASLKVYGARLKLPKLQELPIEPSATIQPHQVEPIRKYCINDCYVTAKLYEYMIPALDLRVDMGEDYGVGLEFLSKSDAQIADTVVAIEHEAITGMKLVKPKLSEHPLVFKYKSPPWIKFKTWSVQSDVLELAEAINFNIDPKSKKVIAPVEFKKLVKIVDKSYQIAIGGIHSANDQGSHFADDDYMIMMFDIGSFYPWIIQNGKFHPRNISYSVWYKLYQRLIDRRMKAKAKLKSANLTPSQIALLNRIIRTIKIILNGLYGQLSQQYSNVADPSMLAYVTVTGQLAVLMMIEHLYLIDVQVISANTDSITVRCLREKQSDVETMVDEWCADTGFVMDYEYYSSIHYLNVNNYFHIETNGDTHGIGKFADDGIRKSQDCSIIRDACFQYVKHGISIEKTIYGSDEIDSFVTLTQIKGGAVQYSDETMQLEPVGKVIRFYRSFDSEYPIQRAKPNKLGTHNKVPKSDNAVIVNDYPDYFPSDLNHLYYIKETYKTMIRLGLIDETSIIVSNEYDNELLFVPKKLVDMNSHLRVEFKDFLRYLAIDKPYLRKNNLTQWIDLIPVKRRKKKV